MPTANLAEAKNHPVDSDGFLKHHREIAEAKRGHEDTGAALARAKKSAKGGSVDLEAYKIIEWLRKKEEDEQIIVLRHVMEYAGYLKMPIGTQFSLMDAPKIPPPAKGEKKSANVAAAEAEQAEWEAGEQGLQAGRQGEAAETNPYPPGSNLHVAYDKALRAGWSERATASRMGSTEHERPADNSAATSGRRGNGRARASQRELATAH